MSARTVLCRVIAAALARVVLGSACAASLDLTFPTTAPNGSAENIPATLSRPDSAGPFPAVVLLHDCSGLGPKSSGGPGRWARELVERGYVVLMPDSFATRGHGGGVCTNPSPSRNEVGPQRRVRDAYAALAYLRTLEYVDGRRIGVMGGSHGGTTTVFTVAAPRGPADPLASEKRAGFAAAVALYPSCMPALSRTGSTGVYRVLAPLLILTGEKDDWTPAEPCRQLAENARAAGFLVTTVVYADAHHGFDSDRPVRYVAARVNANAPGGRGATTGGEAKAWAQSKRDVAAFFAQHLQRVDEKSATMSVTCEDVSGRVSIGYLADHPKVLSTLRSWFEAQWPDYYGAEGPGNAENDLCTYSSRDRLPIGLVAHRRAELCGIAALRSDSLTTHRHFSPWVAALLVAPQYRRSGIGARLVNALEELAAALGYRVIYCATASAHGLLRANAWQLADDRQHGTENILIYRKAL